MGAEHEGRCGLEAFTALAAAAGIDAAGAAHLHADLVARHGEAHRRYHTLVHVADVLANLDVTAAELPDERAVRLAAWFHDAVYDPTRADNEAASAALAREQLEVHGAEPALAGETARLVLVTASHDPTDPAAVALVDADLAVLGAARAAYDTYVQRVRGEYAHLDDATWRLGRAAVLRGLLDRPRLFHHPAMGAAEAAARRNLSAELAALEQPAAPTEPGGGRSG